MIVQSLWTRKHRLEASLREYLFGRCVFFPLRTGYQYLFNREKLQFRRRMRALYGQFIHPGDLVFDVGANVGIYSDMFTELGARVVAIEPNPSCCKLLQRLSRSRDVTVEPIAAGEVPGKLQLYLNSNHLISSLNSIWREEVLQSPLHRNSRWLGSIEVEVTTLDLLARRYGIPDFVKIDVEGFDDRVLCGMSFKPAALTFEFNTLVPDVAVRCLQVPVLHSEYEFNYIHGTRMQCTSQNWLNGGDLLEQIDMLMDGDPSGDVIARRIARR